MKMDEHARNANTATPNLVAYDATETDEHANQTKNVNMDENKSKPLIRAMTMEMKATPKLMWLFSSQTALMNHNIRTRRELFFYNSKSNQDPDREPPKGKKTPDAKEIHENFPWVKELKFPARVMGMGFRRVDSEFKTFFTKLKRKDPNARLPNYYRKKPNQDESVLRTRGYYEYEKYAPLCIDAKPLCGYDPKTNSFRFPNTDIRIPIPKKVPLSSLRSITLTYDKGRVKCRVSYEKQPVPHPELDPSRIAAIDFGVDNFMTVTTSANVGRTCIFKGGLLKAENQNYNRLLSKIKSTLETVNGRKHSKRLQKLHVDHERRMSNLMRRLNCEIVDFLVENRIGTVVCGKNKQWKSDISQRNKAELKAKREADPDGNGKGRFKGEDFTNRKTHQSFIQIPHARFIDMLKSKCEEHTISFMEVEESYTSITDHLLGEEMAPREETSTEEGKRTRRPTRGQFVSRTGRILNSDVNGAIGILRKSGLVSTEEVKTWTGRREDIFAPEVIDWRTRGYTEKTFQGEN